MDPLTHALASYSLKRAAFPRAPRFVTLAILVSGTLADLDSVSSRFGPSAYFTFYRTYFHSFVAALVVGLLASLPFFFSKPKTAGTQTSPTTVLLATLAAALLHLLMDLTQTSGVQLLWPFSPRRFALDWVAPLDLWILAILLSGVLLPLLSGLVTEEIGGRSKTPRGRLGAVLAFVAVVLYMTLRLVYHGNAIAALESRTYRGESSRRVAAFAESSPFRWQGVVETERALLDIEVPVGPGAELDPASAILSYKPETSPALDAARNSAVARRFVSVSRFPKASVEQTPTGYRVVIRDFPYARFSSWGPRVEVRIDADTAAKILSEELDWVPAK